MLLYRETKVTSTWTDVERSIFRDKYVLHVNIYQLLINVFIGTDLPYFQRTLKKLFHFFQIRYFNIYYIYEYVSIYIVTVYQ